VSLYFINFIVNNYNLFPNIVIIIIITEKVEGGGTCYNHFHCLFCIVVCSSRQMPCCPGLLWGAAHVKRLEELLTRQILFFFFFFCHLPLGRDL
jgi:hypothetical protein